MSTPPFHPDQLGPGSAVGHWLILETLGAGGFGRVFKVEREGQPGRHYALKMALRPQGPHAPDEEDLEGRLSHEVAAQLAYLTDLQVHAMDRWPTPQGYLFFVTDYIDGEPFHQWRWRVKPSAEHLLKVFMEVVRRVAELHKRGLLHRDLKSDNILIRTSDERPFIRDYGTVRMPGAVTLTVGVAPASPHLLPPESVLFLSEGAWKQGDRFDAGVPGDLYALGTLLYEALTDGHPFDPKLPTETLMGAILGVRPRRPQEVNPKVPAALGDVAMRLLEKQPQDRYPNAEALLQALWAVGKERRQPEWQASLDRAPTPAVSHQAAHPRSVEAPPPTPAPVPPTQRHTWRRGLVAMSALVGLVLAVWLAHSTLAPLPTKGPLPVPIDSTFRESRLPLRLAAWLCAATSLACTSTPVIPKSEDCSPEARQAMFDVLQLVEVEAYYVVIDVRQPLSEDSDGTYRDGAITGVVEVVSGSDRRLPGGTLLHGRLWAGDDILNSHDYPSVIGRYTEAQLPDGRRLPVCIELGNVDGRVPARPGSRPGEVQMQRIHAIHPVMRWH